MDRVFEGSFVFWDTTPLTRSQNTDSKLLIYRLFQKGRVLAQDAYENWKGFLQEMVARGMREPLLIVTDGNPGVLKAIAEVFPRSLKQRCQKHRLENILCKAPKEVRDELKAAILESFHANSYEQGLKKGRDMSSENDVMNF